MSGIVQGGWEFVAAAYIVTAAVLGGYTISVLFRLAAEGRRVRIEEEREARE